MGSRDSDIVDALNHIAGALERIAEAIEEIPVYRPYNSHTGESA